MATNLSRRLPVGIQSFRKIRNENYLYVDKSDIVWNMVHSDKQYVYLSRPRRFGKSVLVDTLQNYFEGHRELFEGLKIMRMEKEWIEYPVIRFDMSGAGADADSVRSYLSYTFKDYEKKYSADSSMEDSLAVRFKAIISAAYKKTGQPVVVLIDEYDSPLLHSWHTPQYEGVNTIYREVFAILKIMDAIEHFVFITGITKFTQASFFPVINNLSNISFDAEYATICGITKQEMISNFRLEIEQMATANGLPTEATIEKLADYYGGYHFCSDNMVSIYNPFSLINALSSKKLRNYWASLGYAPMLFDFVNQMEFRLNESEQCATLATLLETSDVAGGETELFLYQSGYLTIKGYMNGLYILGIPNHEVRQAFNQIALPALIMRDNDDIQSTLAYIYLYFSTGDLPKAKAVITSLIANVANRNERLSGMDMKERYRLVLSTIFHAVGFHLEVERVQPSKRIDLVVSTNDYVYIMDLMLTSEGGIASAEQELKTVSYVEPFEGDTRHIMPVAMELDDNGKGLLDWKVMD